MTDSYRDPQQRDRTSDASREERRAGFRGGRGPGNRDGGGFKIRLSENEMRSARAIQDAFNLRSTVAVLGFAVRTLAQMLEEGKIDDLVVQYRSNNSQRTGQKEEGPGKSRNGRFDDGRQLTRQNNNKPDPFARPEKPKPTTDQQSEETELAQTDELKVGNPELLEPTEVSDSKPNEEKPSQIETSQDQLDTETTNNPKEA